MAMRVAPRRGLQEGLTKQPDEVVPDKILPYAADAVKQVVASRLRLLSGQR